MNAVLRKQELIDINLKEQVINEIEPLLPYVTYLSDTEIVLEIPVDRVKFDLDQIRKYFSAIEISHNRHYMPSSVLSMLPPEPLPVHSHTITGTFKKECKNED